MKRVPLSEQVRQEISSLFSEGIKGEGNFLTERVSKVVRCVLQEALEQELTDHLGRDRYERRCEEEPHRGYRNGYEPKRVKTAEWKIQVKLPQVRESLEPFNFRIFPQAKGLTPWLERLVQEMYARGLSTRDIEDLFQDAQGQPLLSRTAVSEMTEALWEEYESFCQRDLSGFEVVYPFLDAVYESMRFYRGPKEGLLAAWGITRDGHRILLHLMLGNKESYEHWRDLLRYMVRRGLKPPVTITSDGAPGLISAIEQV